MSDHLNNNCYNTNSSAETIIYHFENGWKNIKKGVVPVHYYE